jgi:hypothetical protein
MIIFFLRNSGPGGGGSEWLLYAALALVLFAIVLIAVL